MEWFRPAPQLPSLRQKCSHLHFDPDAPSTSASKSIAFGRHLGKSSRCGRETQIHKVNRPSGHSSVLTLQFKRKECQRLKIDSHVFCRWFPCLFANLVHVLSQLQAESQLDSGHVHQPGSHNSRKGPTCFQFLESHSVWMWQPRQELQDLLLLLGDKRLEPNWLTLRAIHSAQARVNRGERPVAMDLGLPFSLHVSPLTRCDSGPKTCSWRLYGVFIANSCMPCLSTTKQRSWIR